MHLLGLILESLKTRSESERSKAFMPTEYTEIDKCGFSKSVVNSLKKRGINKAEELFNISHHDLNMIPGIGAKGYKEITDWAKLRVTVLDNDNSWMEKS